MCSFVLAFLMARLKISLFLEFTVSLELESSIVNFSSSKENPLTLTTRLHFQFPRTQV